MNRLFRWVALLVGAGMVAWSGVLISLAYLGASAIPHEMSARRQGGDRGDVQFNRYNWSIHYEFRTPDGETFSGTATAIGSDHAVQRPTRIRYLPAFPYINAPADQAGPGLMPLVLITAGLVVLWALLRLAAAASLFLGVYLVLLPGPVLVAAGIKDLARRCRAGICRACRMSAQAIGSLG